MSYCLGLHIEDNYIRYAKVLKEENKEPKIETYGVMFYDNLQMAIESIIKETYSYNAEIAINLNGEFYHEFETFAGMDYGNLKRHLKLVFAEEVCAPRNLSATSFDTRFIRVKSDSDEDATKVIYVACNKTAIEKPKQLLSNKVSAVLPVPLANLSLLNLEREENFAVLDVDSYTTLTIFTKGGVRKIVNINLGMSNILSKLAQTYKSYSKSYNECKKIILLDEGMQQLTKKRGRPSKSQLEEENQAVDVDSITPILYDIAGRVRAQLNNYIGIVNKIYVTGSVVAMNNIDLYFEDAIGDITVELLKPHFLANNLEASKKMKEIMEVNSAIALAISPSKINDDNIDFNAVNIIEEVKMTLKENKLIGKIVDKLPANIKLGKDKTAPKIDLKEPKEQEPKITFAEQSMGFVPQMLITGLTLGIVAYITTTTLLNTQYEKNGEQIREGTAELTSVINAINADTDTINMNSQKYSTLQNNIRVLAEQLDQLNGLRNDVPSLLTRIALVLPDEVVITKITVNDSSVSIEAQSREYAPLGFFISSLKTEEIIDNISTSIVNASSLQKIVINGVIK